MKNWYRNLNINYQTSIWSAIVTIIALLFTIPLLINGSYQYTLGLLSGGLMAIIFNVALALCDKIERHKTNNIWTSILIFLRLVAVVGLGVLFAFMYYSWNIHVLEPICFAISYLASLIIFVLLSLIESYKDKKQNEEKETKIETPIDKSEIKLLEMKPKEVEVKDD